MVDLKGRGDGGLEREGRWWLDILTTRWTGSVRILGNFLALVADSHATCHTEFNLCVPDPSEQKPDVRKSQNVVRRSFFLLFHGYWIPAVSLRRATALALWSLPGHLISFTEAAFLMSGMDIFGAVVA